MQVSPACYRRCCSLRVRQRAKTLPPTTTTAAAVAAAGIGLKAGVGTGSDAHHGSSDPKSGGRSNSPHLDIHGD